MKEAKPHILCVDDEPNVLDGLRRHLRRQFEVETAGGSLEGLALIEATDSPFQVIVSDLRMPEMDGIEFLARVREDSPDSTRILLTGDADLSSAIDAVNEGELFRFLTKPCPNKDLIKAIQAGVQQHELVTSERVLLERTLHGSVKMLTEILALSNPSAFGRASRVKQRCGDIAAGFGEPARWQMEMAAMVAQVASITLPPETVEKVSNGDDLDAAELEMLDRLPQVSQDLIADIPRLDEVRSILRHQHRRFDDPPDEGPHPIGACILKAVSDLDVAESEGVPPLTAIQALRLRSGCYDPRVLDALDESSSSGQGGQVAEVRAIDLKVGMTLLDPVKSGDGALLVARGQEVSVSLLERLRNFASNVGVKEPIRVMVPD